MLLQQLFIIYCNTMFMVFQLLQSIVVGVFLVLLYYHTYCVAASSVWRQAVGTS